MPCGEVGERLVVVQQPLPQSFEAAVSRARLRGAAFDLAEAAADRRRIDVAHQATDVLHLPTIRSRLGEIEGSSARSEEHTSELQSRVDLVCRLLLDKK